MVSTVLQFAGPIAAFALCVIYLALGGRSPFMVAITAAIEVHLIGDIIKQYTSPGDLVIAGFDLKQMLQPAYFLQWVGAGLMIFAYIFRMHGHLNADYWFVLGFLLYGTGFVWGIIYNPSYKAPAN